jgi:hypothetical protein
LSHQGTPLEARLLSAEASHGSHSGQMILMFASFDLDFPRPMARATGSSADVKSDWNRECSVFSFSNFHFHDLSTLLTTTRPFKQTPIS